MLRKTILLIACGSFLGVAWAGAQTAGEAAGTPADVAAADDGKRLEVTLFLGLLRSDSLDSIGPGAKIDLDEDLDLGLIVSVPTRYEGFRAELIYSRHHMDVTADRPGRPRLAEIDQQYLHIGGLWELGDGSSRGFATASIGVAELDPEGVFYSAETVPSVGLGGGGRFDVNRRVAFRVEGRVLGHVGDKSMFCSRTVGCLGQVSGSLLMQFQAAAGITLRF